MRFLNLHVIFTFAAANPNRDDSGSPKRIEYGGATRSRISSQAMTRPKRVMFEADTSGETTQRSALMALEIAARAVKILAESGTDVDKKLDLKLTRAAVKATTGLTASAVKAEAKAAAFTKEDGADGAAAPKDTLVWLAEDEIEQAARKLALDVDKELTAEDIVTPARTKSLSIAAFGRMFAERPDLQNEAAIQRSHAFTTHATENEVDYFTTVDDLRIEDSGAGHLGLAELTSGVYYWHANIDTGQLFRTWEAADAADAEHRLKQLFLSLFTALPSGKQNTTAHHVLPSIVLAVPANRPVSLQTAFEKPVAPDPHELGYLAPSVARLVDEHTRVTALLPSSFGVGLAATAAQMDDTSAISRVASLEALARQCANIVLGERSQKIGANS